MVHLFIINLQGSQSLDFSFCTSIQALANDAFFFSFSILCCLHKGVKIETPGEPGSGQMCAVICAMHSELFSSENTGPGGANTIFSRL